MSFKDKVVIITGASSGIGAATAEEFAKEGAKVVVVGRNEEKLKKVEQNMIRIGCEHLIIKADISQDNGVKDVIVKTINRFSKIDILINNAGAVFFGSILDGKILESYDKTMATNLRSVVHLTMLAAPYLEKTKGNIINISSVAALRTSSNPSYLAYALSKAAMDHFTRGAALELSSLGIRVNSINPGPVHTDIAENAGMDPNDSKLFFQKFVKNLPLPRLSEPKEIADLILFVSSEKAKGITGSIFVSDNGTLLRS